MYENRMTLPMDNNQSSSKTLNYGGYKTLAELQDSWEDKQLDHIHELLKNNPYKTK